MGFQSTGTGLECCFAIPSMGLWSLFMVRSLRFYWHEAPVAGGALAGLSTLAVVAAFNDTNGGLYMALMGQFGQPRDVAAYTIMSIESGPFLTMVTLGVAGLSSSRRASS